MIIVFLASCLSTNDFYSTSEFGNITLVHMCLTLRPLHPHSISSIILCFLFCDNCNHHMTSVVIWIHKHRHKHHFACILGTRKWWCAWLHVLEFFM